eukprot:TRINITY_DN3040_c0_g1_i8.p1 TRINITY_DN3040_c0_g1~~TRINITY_DN3040_c0_g1_i8.p1  ORF type:complete len:469 (+),score=64.38 TRINITY_DN3040_c0_g1_i8:525-1931(+)
MQNFQLDSCSQNFFENYVFYFYKFTKKEEQQVEILKKIIILGGGIYINELLPSTTHIIINIQYQLSKEVNHLESTQTSRREPQNFVMLFQQQQQKQQLQFPEDLKQFNHFVHILHPMWILDCYVLQNHLCEKDYQFSEYFQSLFVEGKSNNNNNTNNNNLSNNNNNNWSLQPVNFQNNNYLRRSLSSRLNMNQNSLTQNNNNFSFSIQNQSLGINTKKISDLNLLNKKENYQQQLNSKEKGKQNLPKTPRKKTPNKKSVQSDLIFKRGFFFANSYFFIDTYDKQDLKAYFVKIKENSGKILSKLDKNVNIYYVMNDSKTVEKRRKSSLEKYGSTIFCCSKRLIDYCLDKKTHINQTQNINNMNILPFPNKMPMEEFKGKIGYVWGLKQPQKSYTLQTLEIMGVTLNNNYEKMNFIVCGTEKPARKYNEIYKNQACLSRIEVFRIEWIRDCIKFGKYLTDKQYDYHLTS